MPTLRSQTASLLGKGTVVSHDTEAGPASLASPAPLGPATPTQDHEFARSAVTPVIRRSRRLNVDVASVATSELPCRRGKFEGKRKAEETCQEEVSRMAKASTVFSQGLSPVNVDFSNKLTFDRAGTTGCGGSVSCETFVRVGKAVTDVFMGSSHGDEVGSLHGNGRTSLNALDNKDDIEMDFDKLDSDQQGHGKAVSEHFLGCPLESTTPNTFVNKHDTDMQLELGEGSVKLGSESVEDGPVASLLSEETQVNQQELDSEPLPRPQVEAETHNRGRGVLSRAEASRSRFLQIARDRAFHFAHFDADGNEAPAGAPPSYPSRRSGRQPRQVGERNPQEQPQPQEVDWPGPFSTARQLVNNRAKAAAARQIADAPGSKLSVVDWKPTRVPGNHAFGRRICPSLQDLCLSVLATNVDNVVSLEGVPDLVRLRISAAFCEHRNMSSKALSLFFQGEPSEVHSVDCTQVGEDELLEMMKQICPGRLEKLHLGFCGRALSEHCLLTTIASPATSTLLKSISLRGAYRLSDQGLEALLQASPQLVHLDLSNCSFLTNASMEAVVRCVGQTIESLVLDGCPNLNAMVLVHNIVRLAKLRKLSLAEVGGVTDEVVSELCVQLGLNLKQLVLARCTSLTDAAVAAIGSCCPSLRSLNLAHLLMLTDTAVAHITDNMSKIQDLNLKRCKFSDEAIATFVTASGASLLKLSLNSVQQVAGQTITALARHSTSRAEDVWMYTGNRQISEWTQQCQLENCWIDLSHLSVQGVRTSVGWLRVAGQGHIILCYLQSCMA
ncbi:hypothetical protein GOP47_0018089 [Adiantum capillus-veneris]|uniref:F-box/LRR-repeat protein 15-like leucin rich repeat domain-containing protein n=1 Tax=Adiantum capillus-veneris TaxID=13818 RepID=A0A9D4UHT3_ADICA|nr:hypothetical protein GOP47_0018089 [Adiantum capillus-veneris]